MKLIVILMLRWIANIWSIVSLTLVIYWVVVDSSPSSVDQKWLVLGYIPPFWFIKGVEK